jgi:hypothetical protein
MRKSTLLGLGCFLLVSACGGTVRAPLTASEPFGRCVGPVTIRTQSDLQSVAAACRVIDGDLRILGSDLANLDGLESVRTVRNLAILENRKLSNLRGLRGLVAAQGVALIDNPALENLKGLENVAVKEAAVVTNTGIHSLEGFGDLHAVAEIVIAGNPNLESLRGLGPVSAAVTVDIENNGAEAPHVMTPSELASARVHLARNDG